MIRGLAILLVLGEHMPVCFTWARVGWMGVGLFFVLSGFLLANGLFEEWKKCRDISIRRFLVRRAWRIYPSYYLFVLFTAGWIAGVHARSVELLLSEVFLVQDYFPGVWGITWSLAAEEHFYLLLPITLVLFARFAPTSHANPFRRLPAFLAATTVICLLLRIYTALRWPTFQLSIHYMPLHLRLDSFSIGVLVAYLHQFQPELLSHWATVRRPAMFFGSLFCLFPSICLGLMHPVTYTFGFSLNAIAFGMILTLSLYKRTNQPKRPSWIGSALARVGVWSYSIYLWHCPLVLCCLPWLLSPHRWVVFAFYLSASIGLGALMQKVVEAPTLLYRNQRWPSPVSVPMSGR